MKKILALILCWFSVGAFAQDTTSLICAGEMTLGDSNIDLGDGITVVLKTNLNGEKNVSIMGSNFDVEETPTHYKVDPFTRSPQVALSLNRHTLELTYIFPTYSDDDTLIFQGRCELLGQPKI